MNLEVDFSKYNKVIHLSHIDLDGFGCQVYTGHYFKDKVKFYNEDYRDVHYRVEYILNRYKESKNTLFLITDVNLEMKTSQLIDDTLSEDLSGMDVLLLDHHITGKESSDKFSWYYLDERYCATKLTHMCLEYNLGPEFRALNNLSEIINSYDLWKTENRSFKKGVALNEVVFESPYFPKDLIKQKRELIRWLLKESSYIIDSKTVSCFENTLLPQFKERFLTGKIGSKIALDADTTMKVKFNHYIYSCFKEMSHPIIELEGIKFLVFYNLDGGTFQSISHLFLDEKEKEYHACVNLARNGRLSGRSIDGVDISIIFKKHFSGGGHKCAAGGVLTDEKNIKLKKDEALRLFAHKSQV